MDKRAIDQLGQQADSCWHHRQQHRRRRFGSRAIASLAKYHDGSKIKLHIYSTESGVRREKQFFAASTYLLGSAKRGIQILETLGRRKSRRGSALSMAISLRARSWPTR